MIIWEAQTNRLSSLLKSNLDIIITFDYVVYNELSTQAGSKLCRVSPHLFTVADDWHCVYLSVHETDNFYGCGIHQSKSSLLMEGYYFF